MYFKRIEMHGFKSFAEPVVIEFDKGITCVVGPNGSGKSNISDAIRWVLGEQSPKMLRGSKMEDVIFAGTASRKSRGMAEVTLVIDNTTGILPIEFGEVAITRKMYRTGESEYFINNSQCRMREIRELLMDTGIGVDGYSLIGQGKISDIISNKTESIREIFEETAGIVSYRSKKEDAEKKLKNATSNMDRVTDIVFEIEDRIGGLKEDSEKAQEYLNLKEKYRDLEINIVLNNISSLEKKNKTIEDDISNLNSLVSDKQNEKVKVSEALAMVKENNEKLDKVIKEKQEELIVSINELNQMTNANEVNKEKLVAIDDNIIRLNSEIVELQNESEEKEKNSQELFKNKREIEEKYSQLVSELAEKEKNYKEMSNRKETLSKSIENNKNDLFSLHNNLSSMNASKESIISLKDSLENRRLQLEEDYKKGLVSTKYSKDDLGNISDKLESITNKLNEVEKEKDNQKLRYNQSLQKEKDCLAEIEKLKINESRIYSRKKTIEEMENNYEGYNYGVRFIMKSKLDGIFGVVAELINVPKGFELAVETALGGSMQNVVCIDDNTAKKAIVSLKNNNAGRLTFLPLNSIKSRGIRKDLNIEKIEGFKGYGVDIVEANSKYRSVMEYLLANILIVDNMDTAIKISKVNKQGFRIVTLDGEVINASGAFTGGKYKNKSANILERKNEILELEKTLVNNRKLQDLKVLEAKENKQQIADSLLIVNKLDDQYRDYEKQLFQKKNELVLIENDLNEQESSHNKYEQSLKNIDSEKTNANDTILELDIKINKDKDEIVVLEDGIEKHINELTAVGQSFSKVSEEITKLKMGISSLESEKNNITIFCDNVINDITNIDKSIINKNNQIFAFEDQKNSILQNKDCSPEEIKNKEEQKKAIEISIEENSVKKNEERFRQEELQQIKDETEDGLNKILEQKFQLDIKKTKAESQLENLKNRLWDEFEISYLQALEYKDEDFVLSAFVRENREIKNRLKEIGEVNIGSIKEYDSVKERYEFLKKEQADVQKSMEELESIILEMDKIIKVKFKESFDQVVINFEEIFIEFFGGGHGKISMDNEDNPLEATIEINAQPPGKQLKNINLLSGGEKTMTAIALMFAVLKTKPTPCCILDEVEAALDDNNIHIFANYLRKFDDIQFTLITHQKTTMEHADVMYGVTMPERGISKVFSLDMNEVPV